MKPVLASILFASLASTFAFSALAQDATVAVAAESDVQAVQEESADREVRDRIADRYCLRDTGSRIVATQNARSDKSGKKRCANALGRVYTGEDIQRTGAIELTEALRMLDPAIP